MNEKRKRLLIQLEKIIGNEFYNANIQNWGADLGQQVVGEAIVLTGRGHGGGPR